VFDPAPRDGGSVPGLPQRCKGLRGAGTMGTDPILEADGGGEQADHLARPDHHRKERLAQRFGMSDLGEAPARRHRVGAAQHDHGRGALEVAVEVPLPFAPGLDPGLEVGVEEERLVPPLPEPF
jgi:hypothetical protein